MNKRILLIGFHYPPSTLSSGHLRPLAFTQYLPEMGWDPLMLTATAFSYGEKDHESIELIPPNCRVYRAPALDAKRHLGIRGKYPSFLAYPDRWISWWPGAFGTGMYLIKRYRPHVIWATYPLMTAMLVARSLNRMTGVPWIADFRDPIKSSSDKLRRLECSIVSSASFSVFTAPGAKRLFAERYPKLESQGRLQVISNGYDEGLFKKLPDPPSLSPNRPIVFLHSGVLYSDGRDPMPFFKALARINAGENFSKRKLRVVLRASRLDASYDNELDRLGLQDLVSLEPSVSNRKALEEQAMADALLLFQGPRFDAHIPAKIYEYLRIGRPIFALVGKSGDCADLLRVTGGARMVSIDDVDAIEAALREFISAVEAGRAACVSSNVAEKYSRRAGAGLLASLLEQASVL